MQIKKIPISELIPAYYNPRQISPEELQKLKNSINEFGFVQPLLVNKKTMRIVGGHQRLYALIDLGYTEAECVMLSFDEKQEKALNLALNKISGNWEFDKLKPLLQELNDLSYLEITGFDQIEFDALMGKLSSDSFFEAGMEQKKPAIKMDEAQADFPELKEGEKAPFTQMTFTLADSQAEFIKNILEEIKISEEYDNVEKFGNTNSNGNALYCLVQKYVNS